MCRVHNKIHPRVPETSCRVYNSPKPTRNFSSVSNSILETLDNPSGLDHRFLLGCNLKFAVSQSLVLELIRRDHVHLFRMSLSWNAQINALWMNAYSPPRGTWRESYRCCPLDRTSLPGRARESAHTFCRIPAWYKQSLQQQHAWGLVMLRSRRELGNPLSVSERAWTSHYPRVCPSVCSPLLAENRGRSAQMSRACVEPTDADSRTAWHGESAERSDRRMQEKLYGKTLHTAAHMKTIYCSHVY